MSVLTDHMIRATFLGAGIGTVAGIVIVLIFFYWLGRKS